ncbi:MAG: hypothetical protein GXZ11_05550 [Tissierellia bacterium]|nr:hypothetical protein [Tissierellia bacterium]
MKLEKFFKNKTGDLAFLEPKSEIENTMLRNRLSAPIPLWSESLVEGIKEGEFEEEVGSVHIIEGMIAVIGIDPLFKFANTYIEILSEMMENPLETILSFAWKYDKDGDKVKAAIAYRAALTFDDYNDIAMSNLASIYGEIANESEDAQLINELIIEGTDLLEDVLNRYKSDEVRPLLGKYYINAGLYLKAKLTMEPYLQVGEKEEVKQEVRELLDFIEPEVICETIESQLTQGKLDIAEENILQALIKYPKMHRISFLYSVLLWASGKEKESETELLNIIESYPYAHYYNQLLIQKYLLMQYEEGLKIADEALSNNENEPTIMGNRAMFLNALGRTEEALINVNYAINLSESPELTNQLKELRREIAENAEV